MIDGVIAIMGLRSGSTRLNGKNIRPLCGRPLFAWAVDAAVKSGVISRVVVSTDSQEYASLARQYGAEAPFLRPPSLATELSPEIDFVRHALEWLRFEDDFVPRCVVRILATAPLQQPQDIKRSVEQLLKHPNMDSNMVVAEARQHPQKAFRIEGELDGEPLLVPYFAGQQVSETELATQTKQRAFFRSNVIAFRPENLWKFGSLAGQKIGFIEVPQSRAVDIDNEIDFAYAELMLKRFSVDERYEIT